MPATGSSDPVERVRRFNRSYSAAIGVLNEGLPDSAQSLVPARVLFEIAARRQVRGQLRALSEGGQKELIGAMDTIERLLGLGPAPDTASIAPSIALRGHRPGDIGWIIHRQMVLYGREYGWDNTYEALIARIGAQFIEDFDPQRAGCWIAHRGDTILGSVFLVRRSQTVGQLRLLYVEPEARGQGVGDRLVQACIDRAREIGYRRLMLWTNNILTAARRIYERKGFVQVSEARHQSFGHKLVGQNWALKLNG